MAGGITDASLAFNVTLTDLGYYFGRKMVHPSCPACHGTDFSVSTKEEHQNSTLNVFSQPLMEFIKGIRKSRLMKGVSTRLPKVVG